jgi:hypothetical protein
MATKSRIQQYTDEEYIKMLGDTKEWQIDGDALEKGEQYWVFQNEFSRKYVAPELIVFSRRDVTGVDNKYKNIYSVKNDTKYSYTRDKMTFYKSNDEIDAWVADLVAKSGGKSRKRRKRKSKRNKTRKRL